MSLSGACDGRAGEWSVFIKKSLVCFPAQKPIPSKERRGVSSSKMRGEGFRALREYPAKCFAYRHSNGGSCREEAD